MDWDEYFIRICDAVSMKSKDQSTQTGCVIVGPRKEIVSTGWNGSPRGCIYDEGEQTRPEKYFYMEHAERNAIYNAASSLVGCKLYVGWHPCADCARAIIQVGIIEVIIGSKQIPIHWRDHCAAAKEMFRQSGVKCRFVQSV